MPSNTTHQAYKEKLHDKFDDLKQAFLSKANENQLIGNHLITRVLDFWGEILSIDVTEAKYWFREGNSKLPDEIEMHNMPFDIFLSVFKLWLEHSQQLIKEENQSILTLCDYTELLTRLEPEIESRIELVPVRSDSLNSRSPLVLSCSATDQITSPPKFYAQNMKKFTDGWDSNKAKLQLAFNKRKNLFDLTLSVQNLFSFFNELCYICNFQIKKQNSEQENYFEDEKNDKIFREVFESFFYYEKKQDGIDAIFFEEIHSLVNFWFKNDQDIIIITKEELNTQKKLPENYDKNKVILDQFFRENAEKLDQFFLENRLSEGSSIPLKELFPFLKEISIQLGFSIHFSTTNGIKEDLFQFSNGHHKLFMIAKSFLFQTKNEGVLRIELVPSRFVTEVKSEKINESRFSKQECYSLLDFWARTDETIIYNYTIPKRSNRYLGVPGQNYSVRQSLAGSLAHYSILLENASNDFEKRIISETIKALSAQLSSLEKIAEPVCTLQDLEQDEDSKKVILKREERREKALMEIYEHYCKLEEEGSTRNKAISFESFKAFNSDFSILSEQVISKKKLQMLYKKYSQEEDSLGFDSFQLLLQKLADIFFGAETEFETSTERLEALYKEIGVYNGKYKSILLNSAKKHNNPSLNQFSVQTEVYSSIHNIPSNGSLNPSRVIESSKDLSNKAFRRGLVRGYHISAKNSPTTTLRALDQSRPDLQDHDESKKNCIDSVKNLSEHKGSYKFLQPPIIDSSVTNSNKPFWRSRLRGHDLVREKHEISPDATISIKYNSADCSNIKAKILERASELDNLNKSKQQSLQRRICRSQDLKSLRNILKYSSHVKNHLDLC